MKKGNAEESQRTPSIADKVALLAFAMVDSSLVDLWTEAHGAHVASQRPVSLDAGPNYSKKCIYDRIAAAANENGEDYQRHAEETILKDESQSMHFTF